MSRGYRLNSGQVTRAQGYFGRRAGESLSDHGRIIPKARQVQGKGSVWSRHYHDADSDMDTYIPPISKAPRAL